MNSAVLIGKGEPLSHLAIVTENGSVRKWNWIKNIHAVVRSLTTYITENKIETVYSRSWDVKMIKMETGVDIPYIHIKDYFISLTGTNPEERGRLSRFEMAKRVGIDVRGLQRRDAVTTCRIYWKIINKIRLT